MGGGEQALVLVDALKKSHPSKPNPVRILLPNCALHAFLSVFITLCSFFGEGGGEYGRLHFNEHIFFTARQRSCGKVMFSQAYIYPLGVGAGYHWFQLPSRGLSTQGVGSQGSTQG